MPALPLGDAGPYVAAAYLVFLALILVYVGIMASKLVRIERQAAELNELAARRDAALENGAEGHVGAPRAHPAAPGHHPAAPAERP
jgi:type II secretory pathway component PulM